MLDYLEHIVQAITKIERYTGAMDEIAFLENEQAQDALIRNLEIIGEATRNVRRYHEASALSHPEVPWIIAYEMRNALAHGYFSVDPDVVWKTIQSDLSLLRGQISYLLKEVRGSLPE